MKTLTYGTLPDHSDIITAVRECNVLGHYGIELKGRDREMFHLCPHGTFQGRGIYTLNPTEVVNLLESLTCIFDNEPSHGDNWTEEECEWAGEFASSILTTLGFEWV